MDSSGACSPPRQLPRQEPNPKPGDGAVHDSYCSTVLGAGAPTDSVGNVVRVSISMAIMDSAQVHLASVQSLPMQNGAREHLQALWGFLDRCLLQQVNVADNAKQANVKLRSIRKASASQVLLKDNGLTFQAIFVDILAPHLKEAARLALSHPDICRHLALELASFCNWFLCDSLLALAPFENPNSYIKWKLVEKLLHRDICVYPRPTQACLTPLTNAQEFEPNSLPPPVALLSPLQVFVRLVTAPTEDHSKRPSFAVTDIEAEQGVLELLDKAWALSRGPIPPGLDIQQFSPLVDDLSCLCASALFPPVPAGVDSAPGERVPDDVQSFVNAAIASDKCQVGSRDGPSSNLKSPANIVLVYTDGRKAKLRAGDVVRPRRSALGLITGILSTASEASILPSEEDLKGGAAVLCNMGAFADHVDLVCLDKKDLQLSEAALSQLLRAVGYRLPVLASFVDNVLTKLLQRGLVRNALVCAREVLSTLVTRDAGTAGPSDRPCDEVHSGQKAAFAAFSRMLGGCLSNFAPGDQLAVLQALSEAAVEATSIPTRKLSLETFLAVATRMREKNAALGVESLRALVRFYYVTDGSSKVSHDAEEIDLVNRLMAMATELQPGEMITELLLMAADGTAARDHLVGLSCSEVILKGWKDSLGALDKAKKTEVVNALVQINTPNVLVDNCRHEPSLALLLAHALTALPADASTGVSHEVWDELIGELLDALDASVREPEKLTAGAPFVHALLACFQVHGAWEAFHVTRFLNAGCRRGMHGLAVLSAGLDPKRLVIALKLAIYGDSINEERPVEGSVEAKNVSIGGQLCSASVERWVAACDEAALGEAAAYSALPAVLESLRTPEVGVQVERVLRCLQAKILRLLTHRQLSIRRVAVQLISMLQKLSVDKQHALSMAVDVPVNVDGMPGMTSMFSHLDGDSLGDAPLFFSEEDSAREGLVEKSAAAGVARDDFESMAKKLRGLVNGMARGSRTARHWLLGESNEHAAGKSAGPPAQGPQGRRAAGSSTSPGADDLLPRAQGRPLERMVLTTTTKENIALVLDAVENGVPLLLEGGTGVGKSATIQEAATQWGGMTLIRQNMSSRITAEDLVGKISLVSAGDGSREAFEFRAAPFTVAFKRGEWLLLDELNLAPDSVLQTIEGAIDRKKLVIRSSASSASPLETIHMHPDFRLFAAQNPNAGLFKGKREKLSSSFLNRFVPVMFRELPHAEWVEVIYQKLLGAGLGTTDEVRTTLKAFTQMMVDFHGAYVERIRGERFPEKTGYAEASIREVLKVASQLGYYAQKASATGGVHTLWQEMGAERQRGVLAFVLWCVYGSRFRAGGAKVVKDLISMKFSGSIHDALSDVKLTISPDRIGLLSGNRIHTCGDFLQPCNVSRTDLYALGASVQAARQHGGVSRVPDDLLRVAVQAHAAAAVVILSSDFAQQHGLFASMSSWVIDWMVLAVRVAFPTTKEASGSWPSALELGALGVLVYASRFRHLRCRLAILGSFATAFGIPENVLRACADDAAQRWPHLRRVERPYVLLPRVLCVWREFVHALRVPHQPILVVGPTGCGKTEAVETLLSLLAIPFQSLLLTPDMEASELVGQQVPNDGAEARSHIRWANGVITRCIETGEVVLLDAINEADACVLERLNPVLELPPVWVVSENGETTPRPIPSGFRVVATMTPPLSGASGENELSPAMANRFTIINMTSPLGLDPLSKKDELVENLTALVTALLPEATGKGGAQKLVGACQAIWHLAHPAGRPPVLTLGAMVRLLDCAYKLWAASCTTSPLLATGNSSLSIEDCLISAFQATVSSQTQKQGSLGQPGGMDAETAARMHAALCQALGVAGMSSMPGPDFSAYLQSSASHVLSPTRLQYVKAAATAILCQLPVLLEGPAAVGKTALVVHLGTLQCANFVLERVNVSDATTLSDFFGAFLPVGNLFEFQPGALLRAAEAGHWFLADEFNLAPPEVTSALLPLLEGKPQFRVPGTDKVVTVSPCFRFFATQNPSSYANRHKLSPALRSRFVEVQVADFTMDELAEIILKREDKLMAGVPVVSTNTVAETLGEKQAKEIAHVYKELEATGSRISLREVLKWTRRTRMLRCPQRLAGMTLLAPRLPSSLLLEGPLLAAFMTAYATGAKELQLSLSNPFCENYGGGVRFGFRGSYKLQVHIPNASLAHSPLFEVSQDGKLLRQPPLPFIRTLVLLAFATTAREPVLLVGPTSCKSLVVQTWARVTRQQLTSVHLTPETEAAELVGRIEPFTFAGGLHEVHSLVHRALRRLHLLQPFPSSEAVGLQDKLKASLKRAAELVEEFVQEDAKAAREAENLRDQQGAGEDTGGASQAKDGVAILEELQGDSVAEADRGGAVELGEIFLSESFDQSAEMYGQDAVPKGLEGEDSSESSFFSATDVDEQEDTSDDDGGFNFSKYGMPDDEAMEGEDVNDTVYMPAFDSFATYSEGRGDDSSSLDSITVPASAPPTTHNNEFSEDEESFDFLAAMDGPAGNTQPMHSPARVDEGGVEGCMSPMAAEAHTMDLENRSKFASLPKPLHACMTHILGTLETLVGPNEQDMALCELHRKARRLWGTLFEPSFPRDKPLFLFRDGPITQAAKAGTAVLLEDLNLPSQAVVERLNPLLEPNPEFNITEDITCSANHGGKVLITPGFQVIATCHRLGEFERLQLSPATRSRFTEIAVPGYSKEELQSILKSTLDKRLPPEGRRQSAAASEMVDHLFRLWDELRTTSPNQAPGGSAVTMRSLFHLADFLASTGGEFANARPRALLVASRFFLLDHLPREQAREIASKWWGQVPWASHDGASPAKQVQDIFGAPVLPSETQSNWSSILRIREADRRVQLAYTGVSTCYKPGVRLPSLGELVRQVSMSATATVVTNMARLFVAIGAHAPLLLEGPPGIGKTEIVRQVCGLLGYHYERINLAASTTKDQLFGCIVPRFVDGRHVFEWQDGKLTAALKSGSWILLDEINLAAPEVLDGLSPLLVRDSQPYQLPGQDKLVDLFNTRIFATMNPASVGGSRNKLPRSVANLFMRVLLDEYPPEELRKILDGVYQDLLPETTSRGSLAADCVLVPKELDLLFKLHMDIKGRVARRELGRTGGPFELNLRDLTKLRDVLKNASKDLKHHYRFFAANDGLGVAASAAAAVDLAGVDRPNKPAPPSAEALQDGDIRVIALRKFVELVYSQRFMDPSDQRLVRTIIDTHFPEGGTVALSASAFSIDMGTPGFVRIGAVYLKLGDVPTPDMDARGSLVHTPGTTHQLEMLAAACQSGRPVLLQGDTGTRKTSLVQELARIARRQLVVMNMSDDTDIGDVIGQWLPVPAEELHADLSKALLAKFDDAIVVALTIGAPALKCASGSGDAGSANALIELVLSLADAVEARLDRSSVPHPTELDGRDNERPKAQCIKVAELRQLLKAAQVVSRALQKLAFHPILRSEESVKNVHIELMRTHRELQEAIRQAARMAVRSANAEKQGHTFTFVESPLVKAAREGHWVLLDNINSAPQDVVERLNPLLEEKPELVIYEGPSAVARTNVEVHRDFRLFATANVRRHGSHKLSSALLNRMICLHMPPLDAGLAGIADVDVHDMFGVVCHRLGGIHAGRELARVLMRFHGDVQGRIASGALSFCAEFVLTFRVMDNTATMIQTLVRRPLGPLSPVSALVWAIYRNYVASIASELQQQEACRRLAALLEAADLRPASQTYAVPPASRAGTLEEWEAVLERVTVAMCGVEETTAQLACALLLSSLTGPLKMAANLDVIFACARNLHGGLLRSRQGERARELWDRMSAALVGRNVPELRVVLQALCRDMASQVDPWGPPLTLLQKQVGAVFALVAIEFLAGVSFKDAGKRAAVLRRLVALAHRLKAAIPQPRSLGLTGMAAKVAQQARQCVDHLGGFQLAETALDVLSGRALLDILSDVNHGLDETHNRGAAFALQRVLTIPVDAVPPLLLRMDKTLRSQVTMKVPTPFLLSVTWAASSWRLVRQIASPLVYLSTEPDTEEEPLTVSSLMECEMGLCIAACMPRFQAVVGGMLDLAGKARQVEKDRTKRLADFEGELRARGQEMAALKAEAQVASEERVRKKKQLKRAASEAAHEALQQEVDQLDMLLARCVKQCDLKQAEIEAAHHACQQVRQEGAVKSVQESFAGIKASWADLCGFEPWKRMASLADSVILEMQADAFVVLSRHHSKMDAACANATVSASSALSELSGSGLMPWVVTVSQDAVWQGLRALWLGVFMTPVILPHIKQGIALQLHVLRGECPSRIAIASILDDGSAARYPRILFLITPADSTRAVTALFLRQPREAYFFKPSGSLLVDRVVEAALVTFQPGVAIPNSVLGQGCGYRAKEYNVEWLTTDAAQVGLSLEEEIACLLARMAAKLTHLASVTSGLNSPPRRGDQALSGATVAESIGAAEASLRLVAREVAARPGPASQWQILADCQDLLRRASSVPGTLTAMEDSIWVTQKGSGEAIRRLGFTSLLGATEDIVRSKIEGMIRLRLPKGAVGRSHARKVLGSLFQTGEIPATCTVALKALDDASEKTLAERDAAFRMFYGLYCVFSILGRMAAEMGASDAEWKGLKQWWHETPRLLSLLEKDVLNAVLARVRVERGPTISLIQKVGPMDWRAVQGKLDEALTILGLSSEARASRGLSDLFERLWPLCDEGVTPAIPASSGSANVETRDQARKKELAKRCKSQLDEMISAVDKAQPKPYHILQPARELRAYFHRRLQQLDEKDGSSVSENDLKRHSARVSHYQALWEEHRKTKEGGNQVLAACLQGLLPYRAFFRGIPGADHLEALRSAKPVAAESPSVRVSVARMVFQAFADLAKTLAYPSDKGADSDLQDIQALLELSGSFAAWAEASRLCRQMAMPGAPLNAAMSKATVGAAASGSEGKWANGSTAQERLCFLAGLVSNELPTDMEQRGLRAMEPRLCAASLLEPLHRALAQYRATRLLNVRPDFLCGFTHVGKICAPLTTPRWSMLHCYGQLDAMSRREQAVAKATSNFACGIPLSVAPVTLAPVDLVALFVHDRPDLIRCAMDWQDAVDHAHGNGCDSVMLPPAPVHLVSTPSGTPHEHQEALDANPMLWSMMSLPPPKPATLMESLMGPSIMGSMQSSSQLPELLMNFLNQLLQSYASSRTGLGGLSASCEENVPGNLVLPLAIMVVASACRQEMYESVPATTLALKQGIFSQDELQAELQAASAKLGALHEARKMAQSDVQDARKTLHDVDDGREPPPGTAGGGGNDRDALVSARQDAERLLAAREADVHVQEEEVHRLKSQISQALAQKQQAIKDTIHGHMQELSTALLTLFKSLVGTFRIPVPPGQEAKLFDAEPADNLHQLQQQLALLVGLHHQLGAAATQQRMDVRAAAMLRSHVEDIHTRASDHAAVQALEATDSYRKGMLYLSQMHSLGAAALASILPAWQQMEKRLLPAATPGANVTGDDSFMLAKANQAAHQSQHFSLEFQAKAVPLLESCGGHGILDWPQVVSQSNRLVDLAHEMNAKAATEFHQLPAVCSIWRSLALLAGEIVLACTGRVGAQQAVQTDKDFIALRDKARELAKNPKLASVGEDIELEAALKSLSLRVTSAAAACSHVALRIAFDVTNSPLELMSESCGVLSSMGDVALRTIFLAQLMYEGVTCFLGTGSARALTVDELVEVWDLRTLEALHSLLTAFSSVVQSNITTGQCSIIQELLVGPHGIRALNEATLRFQLAATATRYDLCMTLDRPNLFQSLPQLAQALQSELFAASIQSSCKQMSLTLEAETAKRKAAKQQVHFSSVLTPSAATRAPPNSGGSLATGGSGQHSLNDQVLLLLDFRSPQLVQEHVSAFAQKHGLKQGDFEGSLRVIGVLSYSARLLDAGLMEAGNVVVQLQQRSPELLRACLGDIAKDFDSRVKDVLSMMSDSLARLRGATRQPGAPETRGFPGLERALEQLFCYEEYVLGQVVETLWARVARTQRELLKKLSSWVQDAAILEVVLAGDGRWQDLQTPYLQEFVRSLHAYHDEARKLQLGREQARKWWWDRSIEDAEQKFQQEALEYERRRAEYERAVEKNEHDMRTAHSLTDETVHKLHRLATHDDTVPQQQVANLLDDLWRTLSTRSGLYALRNRVQERFFGPKMLLRLKVTNWQEPQKSYMQATISSAMKTVAQLGTKLGTTLLSSLPGIATRSAWRHSVKSAPAEVEISCSLFAPGSQDVVARQIWHFPAREGEEDAVLEAAFQPGAFLLFASSAMPMRPWNEDLPVTPGSWTKAKDGVRYDVLISQEWAPKPTAATGASGDPPAQSSPPDKGAAASEPSASGPSEPASRAAPAANEEPGAVCRVADVNIRKLGTLLQGLKVLPPRPVKRFGNAEGFKRDVHNKSSRASQMDGEAIQKCDLNQHLMRAGKTVVRASHRFAGFKTPVVSAIDGRIASRLLHSSLEDGVEKLLQSWTKVQQTLQTLGDLRKYASFSVVLKDVSRQTILSEQAYDPKDMPIGQVATTAMMEALRDLHELGKGRMRDIFSLMDHLVFVYNELKVAAACIRVCEAMSKGQLKSDKLLTMLKVAKRTSANAAHFLCPGDPNREYQLAMLSLLADSLPPLFQRKKERLRLLRESNEYAQPVEDVVDEPSNLTAALQNIPTNLGDIFVHAEVAAAGGVRFRESSEIVVDFGPVLVESGKVFERRLVVSNRSDRLLKVDVEPVTKDKHNRVHAHAGAKMSSTIAVGDSRSIALSLTAALPAGPLSAHFLLKVSGQPACTLGCSVKAQLQEPRFRLADVGDPAVVDFGDLLCGAPPVSRDILVDNETDVPLGMILRWATGGGTIVKSKSMADPGSLLLKPRGGQAVRLTLVPAQSKESVSLTLDIAMRSGASKQPVSVLACVHVPDFELIDQLSKAAAEGLPMDAFEPGAQGEVGLLVRNNLALDLPLSFCLEPRLPEGNRGRKVPPAKLWFAGAVPLAQGEVSMSRTLRPHGEELVTVFASADEPCEFEWRIRVSCYNVAKEVPVTGRCATPKVVLIPSRLFFTAKELIQRQDFLERIPSSADDVLWRLRPFSLQNSELVNLGGVLAKLEFPASGILHPSPGHSAPISLRPGAKIIAPALALALPSLQERVYTTSVTLQGSSLAPLAFSCTVHGMFPTIQIKPAVSRLMAVHGTGGRKELIGSFTLNNTGILPGQYSGCTWRTCRLRSARLFMPTCLPPSTPSEPRCAVRGTLRPPWQHVRRSAGRSFIRIATCPGVSLPRTSSTAPGPTRRGTCSPWQAADWARTWVIAFDFCSL
eukprot:jgi/Mesvir1/25757/Mv01936-RA.1